MKKIKPYIILLILYGAQATVVNLITLKGYKPDLILVFFLLQFSSVGGYRTVVAGFGIGLFQDLFGGGFWGANALSKTLTGFLLGKLFSQRVPGERWLFLSGLFTCIFLHDFIFWFIKGQTEYQGFFPFLWRQVLPSMLYNSFLTFLATFLFIKKKRWT